MNPITSLSPAQLRQAADIQERILSLQRELSELLGGEAESLPGKRRLSAEGRAAIAAGARARWARIKGTGRKRKMSAEGRADIQAGVRKRMASRAEGRGAEPARKRKFSSESRARLSALTRARWARARKAGKTTL
jgi:hypothetical protein